jgi:hypothetical protein
MANPFSGEIPFLYHYSTRMGRWLANRLGLKGKGSEKLSDNVSRFFWNLQSAIIVHNKIETETYTCVYKNLYAEGCLKIYDDIISSKLYNNLPQWVCRDLDLSIKYLINILDR